VEEREVEMSAEAEPQRLSAEEIIEWSKRYTLYDWAVQSKVSPIPVLRAKGVYSTTPTASRTSTSIAS
jgi:hypothetical protein